MELEFSNINELKSRMMPALKIRVKQLKKENFNLDEEALWNYFVRIWKDEHDLSLADLVDDVLNKDIIKNEDVL